MTKRPLCMVCLVLMLLMCVVNCTSRKSGYSSGFLVEAKLILWFTVFEDIC